MNEWLWCCDLYLNEGLGCCVLDVNEGLGCCVLDLNEGLGCCVLDVNEGLGCCVLDLNEGLGCCVLDLNEGLGCCVLDLVTTQLFILGLFEERYTHLSLALHLCNNSALSVCLPEASQLIFFMLVVLTRSSYTHNKENLPKKSFPGPSFLLWGEP